MLTATHTDGPTFHTRSHAQNTSPNTNSTPQPDIFTTDFSGDNSNTKTTYSRQISSITTNFQMITKW